MDRADESARKILYSGLGALDRPNDPLAERIAQAIRQAQGDIAGEVCPHWTVAVAQFANSGFAIAAQKLEDDHYFGDSSKFSALRDEIDMLIEQAEAKT